LIPQAINCRGNNNQLIFQKLDCTLILVYRRLPRCESFTSQIWFWSWFFLFTWHLLLSSTLCFFGWSILSFRRSLSRFRGRSFRLFSFNFLSRFLVYNGYVFQGCRLCCKRFNTLVVILLCLIIRVSIMNANICVLNNLRILLDYDSLSLNCRSLYLMKNMRLKCCFIPERI
jgi:hypothetical protein